MRQSRLRKRTGPLGWEDLRTVLAVARSGTLSGAARVLDVEHSTVFRRIEDIERRLETQVFERTRAGYTLNARGDVLVEAAQAMEAAALAAERRVLGHDARLTGVVRISTSEVIAAYMLPDLLGEFLDQHPEIEVEIDVTDRAVDLTRHEADLALRATPNVPEHLIVRRIGTLPFAVYGAKSWLKRRGAPPRLDDLPWLGFDDATARSTPALWLRANPRPQPPRLRWGSLIGLVRATVAGLGVAPLPSIAAAQHRELVRLTETLGDVGLYVMTHPDVRGNARVRALSDHLAARTADYIAKVAAEAPICLLQCSMQEKKRKARGAAGS